WGSLPPGLTDGLGRSRANLGGFVAPRHLHHRWHYHADRLAPALRARPGEDWRSVLAAMTGPAGP
ncbi:hypothetical protein ACWIG5_37415, partial [Streptomyces lydicus]